MGTWGSGVFDEDLALDIKGFFDDLVAAGTSPTDAARGLLQCDLAQEILDELAADERDEAFWEESGGLFLAVASLQLDHGVLQPDARELALEAIGRWLELARGDDGRLAALQALRARLR